MEVDPSIEAKITQIQAQINESEDNAEKHRVNFALHKIDASRREVSGKNNIKEGSNTQRIGDETQKQGQSQIVQGLGMMKSGFALLASPEPFSKGKAYQLINTGAATQSTGNKNVDKGLGKIRQGSNLLQGGVINLAKAEALKSAAKGEKSKLAQQMAILDTAMGNLSNNNMELIGGTAGEDNLDAMDELTKGGALAGAKSLSHMSGGSGINVLGQGIGSEESFGEASMLADNQALKGVVGYGVKASVSAGAEGLLGTSISKESGAQISDSFLGFMTNNNSIKAKSGANMIMQMSQLDRLTGISGNDKEAVASIVGGQFSGNAQDIYNGLGMLGEEHFSEELGQAISISPNDIFAATQGILSMNPIAGGTTATDLMGSIGGVNTGSNSASSDGTSWIDGSNFTDLSHDGNDRSENALSDLGTSYTSIGKKAGDVVSNSNKLSKI